MLIAECSAETENDPDSELPHKPWLCQRVGLKEVEHQTGNLVAAGFRGMSAVTGKVVSSVV
jgi:hypothetical protein